MPLEKVSEQFRGKKDIVSGKDSESSTPETTSEVPVLPHRILHAGLPFYSDPGCSKQVSGASLYILLPLDDDGFPMLDVVPSRKTYAVGQYVTWQLNKDLAWEECFYRNPETGQTGQAWTRHVEFVGAVIEEGAIEKDRDRIQKLEEACQQPGSREPVN